MDENSLSSSLQDDSKIEIIPNENEGKEYIYILLK